jgi:hypothetical protein
MLGRPAGAFFLASYWSAGFGTFLQAPALAYHWLGDFSDGTPMAGKLTKNTPLTLRDAPAPTFIMDQLHPTCDL